MSVGDLDDCDLRRTGILVTRPAHQAAGLCELIESHNGVALRFPGLEILPPPDPAPAAAVLREPMDLLIFVSPNAVTQGLRLLAEALPSRPVVGAVGKATAHALEAAGWRVDLLPEHQFDSEGLLALPELRRISGKRVVIVRGEGGRPLLGDTLRERGADLVYAEVYRRVCPDADPSELLTAWDSEVGLVTATSNDILSNLWRIFGPAGRPRLKRTPLLVISERMQALAGELGFAHVLRADNPGDPVIFRRICDWLRSAA